MECRHHDHRHCKRIKQLEDDLLQAATDIEEEKRVSDTHLQFREFYKEKFESGVQYRCKLVRVLQDLKSVLERVSSASTDESRRPAAWELRVSISKIDAVLSADEEVESVMYVQSTSGSVPPPARNC